MVGVSGWGWVGWILVPSALDRQKWTIKSTNSYVVPRQTPPASVSATCFPLNLYSGQIGGWHWLFLLSRYVWTPKYVANFWGKKHQGRWSSLKKNLGERVSRRRENFWNLRRGRSRWHRKWKSMICKKGQSCLLKHRGGERAILFFETPRWTKWGFSIWFSQIWV